MSRDESVKAPPRRARIDAAQPVAVDREELRKAVGGERASRLEKRLRDASKAFDADRLDEALRALRTLANEAPHAAEVRELYGLALYRLGRWSDAIEQLDAFFAITGSTEQHPVRADCHRALRHWNDVETIWEELREASPSAELVVEGRIVAAGAQADRGRIAEAIAMLARNFEPPRRPLPFHLRRMYALADLYERAGDLPAARELFRRIANADPEFFDVLDRVQGLG